MPASMYCWRMWRVQLPINLPGHVLIRVPEHSDPQRGSTSCGKFYRIWERCECKLCTRFTTTTRKKGLRLLISSPLTSIDLAEELFCLVEPNLLLQLAKGEKNARFGKKSRLRRRTRPFSNRLHFPSTICYRHSLICGHWPKTRQRRTRVYFYTSVSREKW